MYSFQLESNTSDVVQVLLKGILGIEHELPNILTQAALDHVAVVKQRIQNRGMNSENERMITKTTKRLNSYSKAYGRYRERKGRQTAQVDFTMNGDLMRAFQVLPAEIADGYVVVKAGFTDDRQADIAEYLEANFGPAFYPSVEEKQVIAAGVSERINNLINRG